MKNYDVVQWISFKDTFGHMRRRSSLFIFSSLSWESYVCVVIYKAGIGRVFL